VQVELETILRAINGKLAAVFCHAFVKRVAGIGQVSLLHACVIGARGRPQAGELEAAVGCVLLMLGSGALDYRVSLVTLLTPLVVQRLVSLAFFVLCLCALSIILVADQVGFRTILDFITAFANEIGG